jgi:multidrug efflux pump subunit AcrA (membrane-fusion protein)
MYRSILVAVSILGIGGSLSAQEEAQKQPKIPSVGIIDMKCEVEGTSTILRLSREGIWVTKDQVIAELDSSALRDQLVYQEIAVKRARAESEQAEKSLEVAELAIREYVELEYPSKLKGLQVDLDFSEDEISLLTDELAAAEKSETATALQRRRIHFDLTKARIAAEEIRGRLEILQKFGKITQEVSRQAEIEKARSRRLATKQAYELERIKEDKLRHQIKKCLIRSPVAGVLVHPGPSDTSKSDATVEEGAKVREGQLLLRVVRVELN